MQLDNPFKIRWDDVEIVPNRAQDIPKILHYWFRCEHSRHVQQHIDWSKFLPEDQLKERLLKQLEDKKPASLTVLYLGQSIGVHNLTFPKKTSDLASDVADLHAHFWDIDARGKQIGALSGFKAANKFFEIHALDSLFLNPPLQNKMSSGLMQKVGLTKIAEKEYESPIMKKGVIASVYQLKKNQMAEIEFKLRSIYL